VKKLRRCMAFLCLESVWRTLEGVVGVSFLRLRRSSG
jgi:hypothetical protein